MVETPPGFTRIGEELQNDTSAGASDAARYSLMTWYNDMVREEEIPRAWHEYARKMQDTAANALLTQWRKDLISRFPEALAESPDAFIRLNPIPLLKRTDAERVDSDITQLNILLARQLTLEVPISECLNDVFWKQHSETSRQAFMEWGHHRTLTLPWPADYSPDTLTRQLADVREAVHAGYDIRKALATADKLARNGQYPAAIEHLSTCRNTPIPDTIRKLFEQLDDASPLAALANSCQQIPLDYVDAELNQAEKACVPLAERIPALADADAEAVSALDNACATIEKTLTAKLNIWKKHPQCQDAMHSRKSRLDTVLTELARLRTAIWNARMDLACRSFSDWEAFRDTRDACSALTQAEHPQFSLYSYQDGSTDTVPLKSVQIANALKGHFQQRLPEICGRLAEAADKSVNDRQKPGYALALCQMARHILAQFPETADSPALAEPVSRIDRCEKQSRKTIADTVLKRNITLDDMSSTVPGLGLTYTRDLAHVLQKQLKSTGLDRYLNVVIGTAARTPRSYNLYDGVVADFECKEDIERKNTRLIRRFGEIRKSPNPEAAGNAALPPMIYTQEVYEQVINMREIERLAHVRVFVTLRGPGFTTPVEINEFYSRRFIVEDSHPHNDVRTIDVIQTYDISKHPVQDAEPVLRYDRIWTPGEMLDWARKDSLDVFALRLLFHFCQYPFMLEDTARQQEQDGDLENAVEHRAYCYMLVMDTPSDTILAVPDDQTARPAARCYEECLANLRKQRSAFQELKRTITDNLLETANRLYKTKH